jgi:transcriptional antiterminator NusG
MTGREEEACNTIRHRLRGTEYAGDYELLVPKRRLIEPHKGQKVEVVKPMFPGYVLARSENMLSMFNRIRYLEKVLTILKTPGALSLIRLEEISNIVYMADGDGIIGVSEVYIAGDVIKVVSGPLASYVGFVKKVDRHKRRIKVAFRFDGMERFIDLSVNFVERPSDEDVLNEFGLQTGQRMLEQIHAVQDLNAGDKVVVVDGALSGHECVIKELLPHRGQANVEFDILGGARQIRVDLKSLRKVCGWVCREGEVGCFRSN